MGAKVGCLAIAMADASQHGKECKVSVLAVCAESEIPRLRSVPVFQRACFIACILACMNLYQRDSTDGAQETLEKPAAFSVEGE